MDTTALYYPYMNAPRTPWFSQVLLYWDQAAAIIPESVWTHEDAIHPYMRELSNAGLLHVMSPDEQVVDRKEFRQAFLDLIKRRSPQSSPQKFADVHAGKMSWELFWKLRSLGLANYDEHGPADEAWWQVEIGVADMYMAYLAGVLSASTPGTFPVTDRAENIGILAGNEGNLDHKLAALRYRVITKALPVPLGPVSARELKEFKEDNADSLRRCRVYLDDKLVELATITDAGLREVRGANLLQTIQDDVAKLQEQMAKKKWPGVALAGFGGVIGAALATTATIASGGTALAVGLGVGAGLMQLGAAGYSMAELINKTSYDRRSPLVYAALAGQLR